MYQNLRWAGRDITIAFPLSACVLYSFTLSPGIAALAMSASSGLVAVNALMLKHTTQAGIRPPLQLSGAKPA